MSSSVTVSVTATSSMMIVVVFPPPLRPAVTQNVGRSGSNDRSITVRAAGFQDVERATLAPPLGRPDQLEPMLIDMGSKALKLIPRDLRAAIIETTGQREQLVHAKRALARVNAPIHMIHGDKDDFAPIEAAERLARETVTRRPIRFHRVDGANHFLNDLPPEKLLAVLETCLPVAKSWTLRWPQMSNPPVE